nr:hypothetical protein [Tanacetum cinerariifolium]
KCEVTLEDEIECDMPVKDVCSPVFTTFSNPVFKDNDSFDSIDDESLPDEDVPAEEFKIYSNPLFDKDEISSDKLDPHCFNVESNFVESLLKILFQTWETFFAIQCSQPEDSNELFQKLLKDLKELTEYDQSTRTDHPIFLNDNEDHYVQNRESPENSSEENVVSKTIKNHHRIQTFIS